MTVVANWIPFDDPAGGPNFGKLDPNARYNVKIDNTGDGYEDVALPLADQAALPQPELVPLRRADGRLGRRSGPQLRPDLRHQQARRYRNRKLVRARSGSRRRARGARQRRPEDDPELRARVRGGHHARAPAAARRSWARSTTRSSSTSARCSTAINLDEPGRPKIGLGNQGGGKDDVAGYNTHAFVLQVPRHEVTRDGKPVTGPKDANAVVGVWATTERRRVRCSAGATLQRRSDATASYVQVSRLGNPLINEVVIPIGHKDKFNRTSPANDAPNFGRSRSSRSRRGS